MGKYIAHLNTSDWNSTPFAFLFRTTTGPLRLHPGVRALRGPLLRPAPWLPAAARTASARQASARQQAEGSIIAACVSERAPRDGLVGARSPR